MTRGGDSEKTVVGRDSVEPLRSFLWFLDAERSRLVRTRALPLGRGRSSGQSLWLGVGSSLCAAAWFRLKVALAVVGYVGWLGGGAARVVAATTNGSAGISLPAFLARSGYPTAPAAKPMDGYVGSGACRECHRDEHASWHASFHRTMTQKMTPESVLGRFDGAEVVSAGFRYRLTKEGDTYFSEGPDPDQIMYWVQGKKQAPPANLPRVKLPVVMATGSHHYQTYWVPSPRHPGVLQTLPVVFLRETSQWVAREAAFLHGPDDSERFVTQWNHHCILCHSTGGNPGLNAETGGLETQVTELGISCESCHGPGREHVDLRKLLAPGAKPERDPIVNPSRLDARRSSEVCGQCHGVFLHRDEFGMEFAKQGNLFRPGEVLERTRYYPRHPKPGGPSEAWADLRRNPSFFRQRWWPDGQILAGGREFTAMRESGCHEKGGMSCLNCHSMHASDPDDQLRRDRPGSTACVECHREAKFTTSIAEHTHHAPASSGSDCRNCHMPHTSYALFKAIRNHQISVPRVAALGGGGPPNACNLCHLDQSLAWTQDWLGKWYGRAPVTLPEDSREISAMADWLIRGHAGQRIIAAWHLGWEPARRTGGGRWLVPLLATAVSDAYGPVRFVAGRSLRAQEGMSGVELDFIAAEPVRKAHTRKILEAEAGRVPAGPGRAERLEQADGRPDLLRINGLLERQDRRSVTVKE